MSFERPQSQKGSYGVKAYSQQQHTTEVFQKDRDEIFDEFRPRIMAIARRVSSRLPSGSGFEIEDMASHGAVGLLEAIERYDPSRGIRFTTYADYRIRGAMIDALRSGDELSRYRREQARDLDYTFSELTKSLGREPTMKEVADKLGMTLEQLHKLRQHTASIQQTPIDATYDSDNEGRSIIETIADKEAADPLSVLLNQELREEVRDAIFALTERKRQCVLLYYGRNMNLTEIAQVFDLTPSRISQILSSARKDLKDSLQQVAAAQGYSTEDDV